jgi:hypothetical protein
MNETINHPVGLRNRRTNVTNRSVDQQTIIRLLSRIGLSCGGKRETWATPPNAGPDGRCPRALADAIWEFQSEWQRRGLFSLADGVVDPGGLTIRHMNALLNGVCGPRVDIQFRDVLTRIQDDFRRWNHTQKVQACTRILMPATLPAGTPSFESVASDPTQLLTLAAGIQPDINGWDVLPLFQGQSGWLRSPRILSRGCATPSSPRPTADAMNAAHEDQCTCSNTVQIGERCWLTGTVNYGTFGIMVKLCAKEFMSPPFHFMLLEYAEALIRGYKALSNPPEDPTLPIAWARATFDRGPSGVPSASISGNRPNCACRCELDGSIVRWDYVWEPVKQRDSSILPETSVIDLGRRGRSKP